MLPCHNEESIIERVVRAAADWFSRRQDVGEIIVVDNGSTDGTASILQNLRKEIGFLTVVKHEQNQGYGGSVLSGCDAATMDIIVYMDSDGQFTVDDLDNLLTQLSVVDFVGGIREQRADLFYRKILSSLWNTCVRILLGINAKDIDCGFKVFRRKVWPLIRPVYGTGNLFSAEIYFRLKQHSISWGQEKVHHFPRAGGKTACFNFSAILQTLRQLISLLRERAQINIDGAPSTRSARDYHLSSSHI